MKYWDSAIAPTAGIKCCHSWNLRFAMGPKKNSTIRTVRKVETAIMAELNATVSVVLLILIPENSPSAAARNIPAKPP